MEKGEYVVGETSPHDVAVGEYADAPRKNSLNEAADLYGDVETAERMLDDNDPKTTDEC